jgi:hypothetical protein
MKMDFSPLSPQKGPRANENSVQKHLKVCVYISEHEFVDVFIFMRTLKGHSCESTLDRTCLTHRG